MGKGGNGRSRRRGVKKPDVFTKPDTSQKPQGGKGPGKSKGNGKGGGKDGRRERPALQALAQPQFEKIAGTRIAFKKGGIAMRVVIADGKEYAPNDLRGVERHLQRIGAGGDVNHGGRSKGSKGGARGSSKGGGKGEHVTEEVRMVKGPGGKKIKQIVRTITIVKEENTGKGGKKKTKTGGALKTNKAGKIKGEAREGKPGLQRIPGKFGRKKKQRERKERTPEQIEAWKEKMNKHHEKKVEREKRKLASTDSFFGEVVARAQSFAWVRPEGANFPAEFQAKMKEMNKELRAKAKGDSKKFEEDVLYVHMGDVDEEGLKIKPGVKVQFKIYTDNKGVGGCDVTSA